MEPRSVMDAKGKIANFACNGHRHLNGAERVRAMLWALLAFGAVALLAELPFVLQGHRVALPVLLLPLAVSAIVALGCYFRFRFSHRRAVGHIDRFFDLKEGLVTAHEHMRENRNEEIHELQLRHTGRIIEPLDPARVRPRFPRRLLAVSIVLLACSISLLLVDDSEAVKAQQAEKETVYSLSEQVADRLEQVLEELADQESPEIKELLEDPSLRQMIKDFQGGEDRKAVMRKLSEIDRRLTQMQKELDTRADENYLMELAEQLRQSRETAALGNALSKNDYRQAADALEGMKLDERSGAAELAALEKMAAQIGETEKTMSRNESSSRQNAQEMARQIQQMSKDQNQKSQEFGQRNEVNQSMERSSDSMRQVAARKEARSALNQLAKAVQQGQNSMSGQGRQPGEGEQPGPGDGDGGNGEEPGGQEAGTGVDRSRRPPGMTSSSEGRLEQLSGQLGEGASEKMVEDAASGTGVSSGSGVERDLGGYERQVEDFVRREDIPEEMKHGVKTYFEQIHAIEKE